MSEVKDQVVSMKRYESAQESMKELSIKLESAMGMIITLEAEKRQWIQEKLNQQNIIAQQLGSSDGVASQLQNEIIDIKRKFKIAIGKSSIDNDTLDKQLLINLIREVY